MEGSSSEESLIHERTLWMRDGELRIGWKVAAYIGVFLLVNILLFVVFLSVGPAVPSMTNYSLIQMLSAFAATMFCMLLIERRPVLDIGLQLRPPAFTALSIGLGLAAGMQLLILAVELAPGLARITFLWLKIESTAYIIIYGFVQFGFVAIGEEVLSRGYPFLALQRRYNSGIALLVTSAVFSLMHAANPSVTIFALVNIFLAGIWLGVARILSGGLWLPIGLHLSWNFLQGTVLGYPVSGIVEQGIMRTDVVGPHWITGGLFGPEGGVIVTVILVAGTLVLFLPSLRNRYQYRSYDTSTLENGKVEL